MGWKNIKEHYNIGHHVQVTEAGICIGSSFIHNLIVIGLHGKVTKPFRERTNEDLQRYQREFDADPAKLAELVSAPDTFAASVTVYTYDSTTSAIIEKQCETPGWPNLTHDGEMMYDNTFSTDRTKVVEWAKENARIGIKWAKERREQLEQDMAVCNERILTYEKGLAALGSEKTQDE